MTIHTLYISAGIDHTWDETLDLQPMFAKRDFEKLSQDDEAHDCKTDVYNLLDIVQKYAGDLDRVFDHIESIHLVEDYDIFFYKTDKRDEKDLTMEQQCESLAYEIELKNEKISKLQTSLNEKTLQLEKEQGTNFFTHITYTRVDEPIFGY